jgi:hypothetical protein
MIEAMETTYEVACNFDQKYVLILKIIDVKKVYFLFLGDFK